MPTYAKVNRLSSVNAAYIAGIVDGEGTITLSRRHKRENRQLVLSISSTEFNLLRYVQKIVGAGRITRKRIYSQKHTPSAAYTITNRQALNLVEQIAPYLHTYKSHRANIILSDYLRLTPRNGKYSARLSLERQQFIDRVMETKPNGG
jgi:hypothetical protein